MARWISAQGQLKWVENSKTCLLCDVTKRKPLTQINQFFFNRNKKSCWIRRWFEQLCSYSSWRVIAFKAFKIRAKILADAGLKGVGVLPVAHAEIFHGGFHSAAYGGYFMFGVRCSW